MNMDDILNDEEAKNDLRGGIDYSKDVTEKDHNEYIFGRLYEPFAAIVNGSRFDIGPGELYERCERATRPDITLRGEDISYFASHSKLGTPYPKELGVFLSALVNTYPLDDISVRFDQVKPINYFGFRLSKRVNVGCELGDHTAMWMQSGRLVVDGDCKGVVGEYQIGGDIQIRGSIRDVGAVRFGGTIKYDCNYKDYYDFRGLHVRDLLVDSKDQLLEALWREIDYSKPITLYPRLKTMLDHRLLQEICKREKSRISDELDPLRTRANEINEDLLELEPQYHGAKRKFEKYKKDTAAMAAITGATLLTPVAPLAMVSGLFTLMLGSDLQSTKIEYDKLKAQMEPKQREIDSLEKSIEDWEREDRKVSKFEWTLQPY